MSDTQDKTKAPAAGKELTAADAARRVKRVVATADKEGKPTAREFAVKADEVLSFRDHGTHVVVVTTDGQKLTSAATE